MKVKKSRLRKGMSLILAATMALSACAVGFTALAADADAIKKIETDILASSTMSDELVERFKALTADEKDQISADAYIKIFNKVYSAQKGSYIEKETASETLLGGHSTQGAIAKEFAAFSQGNLPITIKDGLGAGQDLVLPVTSVANYSFTNDYTATDFPDNSAKYVITPEQQKMIAKELFTKFNAIAAQPRALLLADAFSVGTGNVTVDGKKVYHFYCYMGSSVSLLATNRTLGVAAAYVNATIAEGATNEEKQAEIFKLVQLPKAEPYNVAAGFESAKKVAKALDAYRENENGKTFRNVADPWLESIGKAGTSDFYAAKLNKKILAFDGELQGVSSLKYDVQNAIKEIEGKEAAIAFEKYLKATELPEKGSVEFNAKVDEVKESYKKLTTNAKNYLKNSLPEGYSLYNKILALAIYVPSEGKHEVFTDSVKIDAEMSGYIGNAVYESLVPTIAEVLKTLLSPEALSGSFEMLFSNESVTAAVKMIYPALYGAVKDMDPVLGMPVPSLFNLTPAQLSNILNEPEYAKVKEELAKYDSIDDWAKIVSLDWGVTAGNYEQFITALLSGIKGIQGGLGGSMVITPIIEKMFIGKFSKTPDGSAIDMSTFNPGAWDYLIIPLFEALGLDGKDIPTAAEYAMSATDGGKTFLSVLKPLTDVIYYNLLPTIQKDPLDYVVSNLPNLVYHLQDGCLIDGINRLLDNANHSVFGNAIDLKPMVMGLFADADGNVPDAITLDMIWGMVSPMLSDAGISLTLEDIFKIGKMGTAAVVDTTRVEVDSTVKVTADKESVTNYIINALKSLIENAGIDLGVDGIFVRVEVPAYPHNGKMDKKAVNALITGLEETIGGFVNIEDAINNALATNEMAGKAIKGIYDGFNGLIAKANGTLASIGMVTAPIPPQIIASYFGDAKEYKAIVAELEASDTWADVSFTIKNDDGEVIKQVDMGFKNGDFDGFMKTLVASLRPLVDAIQSLALITNKTVDGDTQYGLYETLIIPVFEALGLKPVATSATFTDNFNKLYAKDVNAGLDYMVNTIIKPVITLLDRFKANPIATVMDVLPNVAYALKYSPATGFIGNLLLGDKNLADVLGGLISGLAIDTGDNENLSKALTALTSGLKLNPINLDALISAGEIKEVDSMSALNKKYTTVVTDKADAFVTVFYYLFDTINTGNNLQLVKDLLATIEMDAGLKSVVDGLVISLFDMTREEALCTLGATFADWTCPDAEEENGGNGNGTNGKTPGTGDTAISAIAVVSVLFTAGAAIVLLRKKKTIAE